MAQLNNVLKAVETLNALRESDTLSDSGARKEKISCCTVIVEGICSPAVRQNAKFPQILTATIETLLALCNDEESDVRMVADESLNKIIRIMVDSNISKIQVELYNEIKRNGPARILRAALLRFGLLSHMIRPSRGKAYVSNLIPCIVIIAHRSEDIVIETLSHSLPLIFKVLGPFMTDKDVKNLLRAFFENISSPQAAFRRAAANMILATCINCRKPQFFLNYVLNHLLDIIMPARNVEDHSSVIIGVFGCLRVILPHICKPSEPEDVETQQTDSLLHIYELGLHYTKWHSDHNVINAALETLVQLLKMPPKSLVSVLLSSEGITQSKIITNQNAHAPSLGQMSISSASTACGGNSESILNLHEPDVPEITSNIDKWISDTKIITPPVACSVQTQEESHTTSDVIELKGKVLENLCGLKIGVVDNEVVEEGSDVGSEIEKSERTTYPSLQSEQSKEEGSYSDEATLSFASPKKSSLDFPLYEADVGSFTDSDMPVKFCCRYLVSSFLLAGKPGHLISDKLFRVSVKSLALTCVGYILKLDPHLFTMTVAREPSCNETNQLIADILLFANHPDPQIRGNIAMVIGFFLKSVFVQYGGSFRDFEARCSIENGHGNVSLDDMIKLLLNGLNDDSATTCRQTLDALNICLTELLESVDNEHGLTILAALPKLMKNSYFLVKVKLVQLLSKLSYVTIEHIAGQTLFQEHFVDVIITLLGDQDQRVRHAASDAIVKSIPFLYFRHPQEDTVTRKATRYTQQFLSTVTTSISELSSCQIKHKPFVNTSIKPFVFLNHYDGPSHDSGVEYSLSRVVNILTEIMTVHSSKYLIYGCCETLFCLSETYPTTVYVRGWDYILPKTPLKKSKRSGDRSDASDINLMNEMIAPVGSGLLSLAMPLLTSSTISLDLSTHRHLILLAGNLASGLAVCNFKAGSDPIKLWSTCKDKHLEFLLTHIMRVLNIFVHVIDEVQLTQSSSKPLLPSLSTAQTLSPKKKIVPEQSRSKEKGEKIGILRSGKELIGTFVGIPHYMKIHDILKAAHSNYLVTLQHEASEMYVSLLNATLDVLSQILEIAFVNEAGRIAEEVLYYLKTTVVLSPTATVRCVQQLLKCLFGTNVCAQWSELDTQKNLDRRDTLQDDIRGFYNQCFQHPARQMANTIKRIGNNCRGENEPDTGWIGLLRRKSDRKFSSVFKTLARSSDQKTSVASFIRLFEPMVIKSLKQYTVTSNIALQCQVLMLLSQLVQLKVNYCLLDSDKIFIGFVLKQFEFIEEGHIQQTEELLPKVFNFLVHLSYEKNHSKTIIGVPKIIQLCDGLMASGQPAISHCIPALAPVIEDIFLVRNGSSSVIEQRELETTKDVLIAMLLRLVEYHEVIELLALCLAESRFSGDGNGEEKWRRWSRLTMDTVLPIMAAGKLKIESEKAHIALVKLFAAISPTVFRPVDPLLKILFTASISATASTLRLKRWLGMINVVLLSLISCAKEEAMLARLSDLSICVTDVSQLFSPSEDPASKSECNTDPLNVMSTLSRQASPEQILARFIFKVINLISTKVFNLLGLINHKSADPFVGFSDYTADDIYLVHQFAFFLQLCIHMFESGSHCKVANATMQMIQGRNVPDEEKLLIDDLNYLMLNIGNTCPTVTCQWAYLMILLGYNEMSFWSKILGIGKPDYVAYVRPSDKKTHDHTTSSINIQIIRRGGIILFCDYICENLNDVEPLTWLLVNHIEEAINIATESPVRDLLTTAIHRNPAASGLLVQAIATKCTDLSRPSFIKRLLQCIEGAHHSQSGAVIMTLIPGLLSTKYLALSRMAAKIASRKVEILLTTNAEDVINQLSKEEIVKIMDTLQITKLARKHGGLVSLLNKLAVQYYDLSPLELDQCRPFNPSTVKSVQLDRNWFLSQVKLRCCQPNVGNNPVELAQLLKNLDFDDCMSILSCKEFNLKILKHCVILGARLSVEKCQQLEFGQAQSEKDFYFDANPLYVAAKQCLLEHIHYICEVMPKPHQIYNPEADNSSGKELKYAARFSELLSDSLYWEMLFTVIPTVRVYMKTLPKLAKYNVAKIDVKFEEDIARFSLLCLELAHWMIHSDKKNVRKSRPHDTYLALSCAAEILRQAAPSKIFGDGARYTWVCSAAISLTKIVESILTTIEPLPLVDSHALEPALRDEDTRDYARACIQMTSIVTWLEKCQVENSTRNIPPYLFNAIKSLVISVSRQPLVNSYILTPPLVWRRGCHVVGSGPTKCYFPLLSSESNILLEVDILEQFIYRVNLLGWTSRSQFEEIWMAFLSVLNFLQNENAPSEEMATLIQASSLAIQAITRLLLQTLLLPCPGNPDGSAYVHHPRDPQLSVHKISSRKLYAIQELLIWKYEYMNDSENKTGLKLDHIFHRTNVERTSSSDKFMYSQLSVSYLWSLCNLYEDKLNASVLDLKNRRNDALMSASLDLDSCLRFLIEHYTTWLLPQANTPVQLLTEIVKSILAISELFLERSQYQWMLDVCLEVSRIHPSENAILHQYLAISVCKAAAVLTPLDLETLDKVKRIVDVNLKSGFLASRVSALHGSLYLLQSAVLTKCEETMNIIHPLTIEYIQKHIDSQDSNSVLDQSEEHQGVMWALVFFLLEHAEDTPPDTEAPAVLELVLSLVTSQNISYGLHQTLLQGLERLVATRSVVGKVAEQIVKVAIDRLKQPSPLLALPALQLLLTCMYTEAADRLNQPGAEEPLPDVEPEALVRSIERISAIFDKIRKGHPMEVEVLCTVLSHVLTDFFPPSEILTKVIGEFLSPQQPHPRLLSAVVFKVCEKACTSTEMELLQDWVVFSLPNFIQSLPIAMSTWCLSCFFISASTNHWLRALFPYVQSRIGKYDYEDKKILCIAASDFYYKLPKESQKKAFVETFETAAKEPGTPFTDILTSF
ncbi:huntingtin isoform X2 [Pseudomyrmex gracilis]|uniref:huntingtin isoform X2 n=1 Tax=Pseudomyrmex gracilis TaxID=219809 RepID=UPI0009952BB5|nr:huntingtin isoform X2 [Pseudomyrmex gracilis]